MMGKDEGHWREFTLKSKVVNNFAKVAGSSISLSALERGY